MKALQNDSCHFDTSYKFILNGFIEKGGLKSLWNYKQKMPRKCPNKSNKNCRNERNQCQQKKKYGCPQNYTGARNVCNNKLLCTEGNTRYTNLKMDAGNCGCKCQYDIPPVPNGPPDDGNLWDLQFCRWWGWNWVRKQEELQNQQRCMRKSPV